MTTPAPDPIRTALQRVASGATLTEAEARAAFDEVMAGLATPAAVGALLFGLRARGETPAEVAGAAGALRASMHVVPHGADRPVDTCGTGGGTVTTLNISTAAAFIAAGAGVPVAKHGNRSFTSRSGSADVLEALGLPMDLGPERAGAVLDAVGLTFLFAPLFHPAMRHVAPIRRDLGVPTVMNLIGPLANPAGTARQVVGVADPSRGALMAEALARLGTEHALVVHAEIGMDEIAPVGLTRTWEVRDGIVTVGALDPASLGLATSTMTGLEGGEPAENAARIEGLLERPAQAPEPLRAAVLLNATAAIYVGGRAESLAAAADAAQTALASGAGAERLAALRAAVR